MEETREKIVISILISLTILLWFINQWLTNQLYYGTPQYVKNQALSKKYEQSNNLLKLELLHLESYNYIEQVATKEGFVPATFIYLQ